MRKRIIMHRPGLKKLILVPLILAFFVTGAYADLEWITGGVPKNTADKQAPNVVKDAPADESHAATSGNQDIVVSHMITCTKLANQYPVDSVNFFYLNKSPQICYYAYFLLKPSSRIHTATVECFSPSGLRVAKYDKEFRVGFVDRLLTIQNETYQWFMVDMIIGMDHMHSEYGQSGLPKDIGLYTVHLVVDGQLVGITFFYVKQEEAKPQSPVATVAPVKRQESEMMPMSTPFSNVPLRQKLK